MTTHTRPRLLAGAALAVLAAASAMPAGAQTRPDTTASEP